MKLIAMDALKDMGVNYSRPHIYRLIKDGKFPKQVKLGAGRIAFVEQEIVDWLKGKVAERDVPPHPRG